MTVVGVCLGVLENLTLRPKAREPGRSPTVSPFKRPLLTEDMK